MSSGPFGVTKPLRQDMVVGVHHTGRVSVATQTCPPGSLPGHAFGGTTSLNRRADLTSAILVTPPFRVGTSCVSVPTLGGSSRPSSPEDSCGGVGPPRHVSREEQPCPSATTLSDENSCTFHAILSVQTSPSGSPSVCFHWPSSRTKD